MQKASIISFTGTTKTRGDGTYLVYFVSGAIVFDKRLEKDEYFPELSLENDAFRDARYSKSPLFRAEILHGEIVEFSILAVEDSNEDD